MDLHPQTQNIQYMTTIASGKTTISTDKTTSTKSIQQMKHTHNDIEFTVHVCYGCYYYYDIIIVVVVDCHTHLQ